jgi:hypothetical protein
MITPTITNRDRLEAWLKALDEICFSEMGVSYRDLPDQCFKDWHEDGLTPEDAYYMLIEDAYPGLDVADVYTQEFDTFTDADPRL